MLQLVIRCVSPTKKYCCQETQVSRNIIDLVSIHIMAFRQKQSVKKHKCTWLETRSQWEMSHAQCRSSKTHLTEGDWSRTAFQQVNYLYASKRLHDSWNQTRGNNSKEIPEAVGRRKWNKHRKKLKKKCFTNVTQFNLFFQTAHPSACSWAPMTRASPQEQGTAQSCTLKQTVSKWAEQICSPPSFTRNITKDPKW